MGTLPLFMGTLFLFMGTLPLFLGTLLLAYGYPSLVYGYPSLVFGYPSLVFGYPSLVYGYPSLVYGYPSLVHGYPSLVYGYPSLVYGYPSLDYGYPFLVYGYPSLDYGYLSIVYGYPSTRRLLVHKCSCIYESSGSMEIMHAWKNKFQVQFLVHCPVYTVLSSMGTVVHMAEKIWAKKPYQLCIEWSCSRPDCYFGSLCNLEISKSVQILTSLLDEICCSRCLVLIFKSRPEEFRGGNKQVVKDVRSTPWAWNAMSVRKTILRERFFNWDPIEFGGIQFQHLSVFILDSVQPKYWIDTIAIIFVHIYNSYVIHQSLQCYFIYDYIASFITFQIHPEIQLW